MDMSALLQMIGPMMQQMGGKQGMPQGNQGMNMMSLLPLLMQQQQPQQDRSTQLPMRPPIIPQQAPATPSINSQMPQAPMGMMDLVHRFQPGTNPNQTGFSSRNYGLPQEMTGQPFGIPQDINGAQNQFGQRLTPEMIQRLMMMRGM